MCVAVSKEENRFKMCLESRKRFSKVKNTNVNRIGKTYLKIRGFLKTVIYGREGSLDFRTERQFRHLQSYAPKYTSNPSRVRESK